jgi:ABC-type tungstate transport system substrate-binding protein
MELLWQGTIKALQLIFGLDAEVWSITWLSLKISGFATCRSKFPVSRR